MDLRNSLCGGMLLVAALSLGCSSPATQNSPSGESSPSADVTLRLLVIDDPELAAAIERQWKARSEADLTVSTQTVDQAIAAARLEADAVIYPSALIGELAERRLIAPLNEEALQQSAADLQDVFDLIRLREASWGQQVYAVPFGSPTLTLMYRADVFEKLGLQPPRDWEEYRQAAERLSDRAALGELAPARDQPWRGVLEPLGAGWAGEVLLARAAAYARHRSQYSTVFNFADMTPRIDGPPFTRALQEMAACGPFGLSESLDFSPADVRRELLAGRCGMALAWPTSANNRDDKTPEPVAAAFAELPGSREVYNNDDQRWETRREDESPRVPLLGIAGRLGSVTVESPHRDEALAALAVLSSPSWSGDICTRSSQTTLFRYSQISTAANWVDAAVEPAAATAYAETVAETLTRDVWMFSPRIPGRGRYLPPLDEAVRKAASGDASPEESLQAAARRWDTITGELGADKQKAAYRRSLGVAR